MKRRIVSESSWDQFEDFYKRLDDETKYESGVHVDVTDDTDSGKASIKVFFDDYYGWDDDVVAGEVELKEDSGLQQWIHRLQNIADKYGWDCNVETVKHYDDEPFDEGLRNDSLARITLTCSYYDDKADDVFESVRKPHKVVKESTGKGVEIKCRIDIEGDTIDEALQTLHEALLSADAGVTDGNENPNPKIVSKYNYWNKENEGDGWFTAYYTPGVHYATKVEVKNF